jgi:hypothetical protein
VGYIKHKKWKEIGSQLSKEGARHGCRIEKNLNSLIRPVIILKRKSSDLLSELITRKTVRPNSLIYDSIFPKKAIW